MGEYPTFPVIPPSEPLWQMPVGQPHEVLICCAEALRPMACVVVDALVVRGFQVTLLTGSTARMALRLSLQSPARGLRVLCLPRRIDGKTHRRLLRNLDGDVRDDLLVVPMLTPRTVIDAIEGRAGIRRARPRRRYTKAYIPHPIVSESRTDGKKWLGYGALAFTATAAFAVVVGGAELTSVSVPAASLAAVGVDPPRAAERPSLLLDDAVHAAARIPLTSDLDDEDPPRRDVRRPKRPRPVKRTLTAAPPHEVAVAEPPPEEEEEVIVIEDDEDVDAVTDVVTEADALAEADTVASTEADVSTHDEVLDLIQDPPEPIPAAHVVAAPKHFGRVGKRRFVPRRTTLNPVDPFKNSL